MKIFVADDDGGGTLHVEQGTLLAFIYGTGFGYNGYQDYLDQPLVCGVCGDKVILICYLVMKG